jgi:hypothetical protein
MENIGNSPTIKFFKNFPTRIKAMIVTIICVISIITIWDMYINRSITPKELMQLRKQDKEIVELLKQKHASNEDIRILINNINGLDKNQIQQIYILSQRNLSKEELKTLTYYLNNINKELETISELIKEGDIHTALNEIINIKGELENLKKNYGILIDTKELDSKILDLEREWKKQVNIR